MDVRFRRSAPLAAAALALGALFVAEKLRPLRVQTRAEPRRTLRNLALGATCMAVIATAERPVATALARAAVRRRIGVVQRLALPAWARDVLAFVALDYSYYLWHVATHRSAVLWRLHLVHHIDLDMDMTTALRFHAADMLLSVPLRVVQVTVIGVSPRALAVWQNWFFASVLFHHSNLRLSDRADRLLALVVTTPRMHGIHHMAERGLTDSNWSSGLSIWDRLHGTLRQDVPPRAVAVGVPGYSRAHETGFVAALELPFGKQKDAWQQIGLEDHRGEQVKVELGH